MTHAATDLMLHHDDAAAVMSAYIEAFAMLKYISDICADRVLYHKPHPGFCRPNSQETGPEVVPSFNETWTAVEALVDMGLVRSIGLSNFSPEKIEVIMKSARIKPAVNQVISPHSMHTPSVRGALFHSHAHLVPVAIWPFEVYTDQVMLVFSILADTCNSMARQAKQKQLPNQPSAWQLITPLCTALHASRNSMWVAGCGTASLLA